MKGPEVWDQILLSLACLLGCQGEGAKGLRRLCEDPCWRVGLSVTEPGRDYSGMEKQWGRKPKSLLGVRVWGWGDASNLKEKITEQKIDRIVQVV